MSWGSDYFRAFVATGGKTIASMLYANEKAKMKHDEKKRIKEEVAKELTERTKPERASVVDAPGADTFALYYSLFLIACGCAFVYFALTSASIWPKVILGILALGLMAQFWPFIIAIIVIGILIDVI